MQKMIWRIGIGIYSGSIYFIGSFGDVFFVCVFFILGLIFVILGQELLFWRWRSEGIVIYHPAAYTPHHISLIELSGLALMSFALAMLIRLIRKEITDYMIF